MDIDFDEETKPTSFSDEDVILAVKHGVVWLDENHPGWANQIDLSRLMMNNCTQCVIGQAVGDYFDTIVGASNSDACHDPTATEWSINHGFNAPYFDETGRKNEQKYFRRLEEVWSEEVVKRLG